MAKAISRMRTGRRPAPSARPTDTASKGANQLLNHSLSDAKQGTVFPEYDKGNGKRQMPKPVAVIVDHVKAENNDGAADIEDVKLFLKKNKANRIALKGNDQNPGGDFRSPEYVGLERC